MRLSADATCCCSPAIIASLPERAPASSASRPRAAPRSASWLAILSLRLSKLSRASDKLASNSSIRLRRCSTSSSSTAARAARSLLDPSTCARAALVSFSSCSSWLLFDACCATAASRCATSRSLSACAWFACPSSSLMRASRFAILSEPLATRDCIATTSPCAFACFSRASRSSDEICSMCLSCSDTTTFRSLIDWMCSEHFHSKS
mmetsp:Transcript_11149/g.28279  ORF Transcript_11149/g.28279 Transcript_11149/m.28279 type:complete len:207 (+) Transcript_11149:1474-2094(+)